MHERNGLAQNENNFFCERLINYFTWNNYLRQSTRGNCLGSNYLKGNYPGIIIWGAIIQAPIVWGQFFWGLLSGEQLSGRQLFWGGAIILELIQTTCSVSTFSVGRQIFCIGIIYYYIGRQSDKYFWIGKLLRKNYLPMK